MKTKRPVVGVPVILKMIEADFILVGIDQPQCLSICVRTRGRIHPAIEVIPEDFILKAEVSAVSIEENSRLPGIDKNAMIDPTTPEFIRANSSAGPRLVCRVTVKFHH